MEDVGRVYGDGMRKIVFHGGPMHGARWIETKGDITSSGQVWFGSERYVLAVPPIPMAYGELVIFEYA